MKDISWAFCLWLKGYNNRKAFVKKYCELMGDDTSDEYVDEIILEAEYFDIVNNCFVFTGWTELHRSYANPRYNYRIHTKVKALIEESKTDPQLRKELLEGLVLC